MTHAAYRRGERGEWKHFRSEVDADEWNARFPSDDWKKEIYTVASLLPDYFGDLNACHELLKTITKDQCNDFNRWITDLRGDIPLANDGRGPQSLRWSWGQPAEIVAEAFGKSTKLW